MKKYPIVVLCITLLLVIASLVLTFVGAFTGGTEDPLFKTGIAGLIAVPTLGWVMVAVYNRVHMEETVVDKMVKKQAAEKSEEDSEQENVAE